MFQMRDTMFANNTRYCREEDGRECIYNKIFDRQKIILNVWLLALLLGMNH